MPEPRWRDGRRYPQPGDWWMYRGEQWRVRGTWRRIEDPTPGMARLQQRDPERQPIEVEIEHLWQHGMFVASGPKPPNPFELEARRKEHALEAAAYAIDRFHRHHQDADGAREMLAILHGERDTSDTTRRVVAGHSDTTSREGDTNDG